LYPAFGDTKGGGKKKDSSNQQPNKFSLRQMDQTLDTQFPKQLSWTSVDKIFINCHWCFLYWVI